MILCLQDQTLNCFFNAFPLIACRQGTVQKLKGQLGTFLFICFGVRTIQCIVEENSELNNVELFFAKLLPSCPEFPSLPLLQQSQDVLVAMIESPMLGVLQEQLFPPSLHFLVIADLHSANQLVEMVFIVAVFFNCKMVFRKEVFPNEGAGQLFLDAIIRRNSWTYDNFQLFHLLASSNLVYLVSALHCLFGKDQSINFFDFDGDSKGVLQEKADDLDLGFYGFNKFLNVVHSYRPRLQHFLRLFLSKQFRS